MNSVGAGMIRPLTVYPMQATAGDIRLMMSILGAVSTTNHYRQSRFPAPTPHLKQRVQHLLGRGPEAHDRRNREPGKPPDQQRGVRRAPDDRTENWKSTFRNPMIALRVP